MEGFKEFQGKDLDDAIGQACSYYDTLREKLEIDIIHDSKSGIFGIVGARKAKIKARRVQLRNAVDSILGRGREDGGEESPAPVKAGRAPQGEKPARSTEGRGDTRSERNADRGTSRGAARSEEQPRQNIRPADTEPSAAEQGGSDSAAMDDARCEARPERTRPDNGRDGNGREGNGRSDNERKDERDADNGRRGRNQRPSRSPASAPSRGAENRSSEPRALEGRSDGRPEARHDSRPNGRSPEYRYDGNSILSGQVQGYVPEVEDDEEASFGPGNEMPASHDGYADRNAKPRRGRNSRPPQGRPESSPPRAATTSILAGTLDNDALNEDALSEGLPVVAFDQLDQDRLCAISLEAVGRLVGPIVGDVPLAVELCDNRVNVVLDCGDDSGLLIGREGQTLASLQYLASRLVSRAMGAAVRVQLDAGEYRLRQDEKLRDLALSLAERVRATGKSHSTRPLSSYHRRIVHMALQDSVDIQTRSSGDGALKRVVIQKKRGSRSE